jgi:hypothetical protein
VRYELCSGIDPKDSTDVLDSAGGVEAEVLVQAECRGAGGRADQVAVGRSLPQSTIATALEQHLLHKRLHAYRLDGDNIRFGLNKDLGFDPTSRVENLRPTATWSARPPAPLHRDSPCQRQRDR